MSPSKSKFCKICGCGENEVEKLFCFPRNIELTVQKEMFNECEGLDAWKKILGIKSDVSRSKWRICSNHFSRDCFKPGSKPLQLKAGSTPMEFALLGAETSDNHLEASTSECLLEEPSTSQCHQAGSSTSECLLEGPSTSGLQEGLLPEGLCSGICTPPIKQNKKPLFLMSDIEVTPKKRILVNTIKKKERLIRKFKKSFKKRDLDLKQLYTVNDSTQYKDIFKGLSPTTTQFLISQIRCSKHLPKGRRWSLDDKILSLAILKKSPKCYSFLSKLFALPSRGTLLSLLNKVRFNVGINNHVFAHLSDCLSSFENKDKFCVLSFDEMSLREHLEYNSNNDSFSGLEDFGSHRTNLVANYALVFMAQGICKPWKQPLAFYFAHGGVKSEQLVSIIKEVLTAMENVNLNVIATVCDMGTANVKALKMLGCTVDNPCFTLNGRTIYSIFDVPHLLKCTRNLFMKYNIDMPVSETLTINSEKQILQARWSDLKTVYEDDKNNPLVFRTLYKLTDSHLAPTRQKSMKVKVAAQILSRTVSSYVYLSISRGILPPRAVATASFIMNLDSLFDSLNGSSESAPDGKPLKRMVCNGSGHTEFWTSSKDNIKQWRYLKNPNTTHSVWKPPSQKGWLYTLEAFIGIQKLLVEHGVNTFKPRSFNQDPLENLFGAIRSGCGNNENPTVSQFISSFKTQVVNNLANQSFKNTNCERDDFEMLSNLKSLLEEVTSETESTVTLQQPFSSPQKQLPLENISLNVQELVHSGAMECLSVAYVAGFIVKKLFFKFSCNTCLKLLCSDKFEPFNEFIAEKESCQNKTEYVYPSENLVIFIGNIITGMEAFLKKNRSEIGLTDKILQHLGNSIDHSFLSHCEEHSHKMSNLIITSTCKIGLPWYCKRLSRTLIEQRKNKSIADRKLRILNHL